MSNGRFTQKSGRAPSAAPRSPLFAGAAASNIHGHGLYSVQAGESEARACVGGGREARSGHVRALDGLAEASWTERRRGRLRCTLGLVPRGSTDCG